MASTSGPGESDGSPVDSDCSSKPPAKKVKSRSRVWQKVTRFTKKGRPVKGECYILDEQPESSIQDVHYDMMTDGRTLRLESSSSSEGDVSDLPDGSFVKRSHLYPNCEIVEQSCLRPSVARALFLQLDSGSIRRSRLRHPMYRKKKTRSAMYDVVDRVYSAKTIHGVTESETNTDTLNVAEARDGVQLALMMPSNPVRWGSTLSLDTGLDSRDVCFISSDVYSVPPPSMTNSASRKRTKCQPKSQSLPSDYRGARQRLSRNKRSHLAVSSRLLRNKSSISNVCKCTKKLSSPKNETSDGDSKRASKVMDHKMELQEFCRRRKLMKEWFTEMTDEQKNIVLKDLLECSDLAQHHMLSVEVGSRPHEDCPPNCQDLITWLPRTLSLYIMSYLDPVSLCQASQVCQCWNELTLEPCLWRCLCFIPKWRLSRAGEEKQLIHNMQHDGSIMWKEVFAERFRLRMNWLRGRCNVRTFEGHTQGVSCVQFDDTRIVSGSSDKTIKVWNIRTNTPWLVQTLVGHSGTVRCLHLDGSRLVSGSTDRTIKVWDLSTHQDWTSIACKVTMVGHTDTVRCLQVGGDKVISGSYDKTLKLWDIRSGHCNKTFRGHDAAVLCVQFDEDKIVSGSADKTIKVWTMEGQCMTTLQSHHDAVTCLQFDATRIVSGSLDCNLKFWDIRTGECSNTIDWKASEGHTGVVRCLQADSWKVVSSSDDRTLKVWSLDTGQRLATLRNHTDGVTCLQFNDSIIVSGSYDKTVKLWDFSCC